MSEWRETREAIRLFGIWRVLYWHFVYRHHMRFIHRRGGHQFTELHPMGGPAQRWCQWCGERTGLDGGALVTDLPTSPARKKPAPVWQDIETAPKDGSFVLLFDPTMDIPVTVGIYFRLDDRDNSGRFKAGKWNPADWSGWLLTDSDGSPSWCEPTHWMPLPEPPK